MNQKVRRIFLGNIDKMVTETIKKWKTWEDRWSAYCAFLQAASEYGGPKGVSQKEVVEEIGGELAKRLIDALGAPPITDVYQSLLYYGSNWAPHRVSATIWNQTHQDELNELQRQHPEIPLLTTVKNGGPTGRYVEVDGEQEYFINLRQALYLMEADEDPTPAMTAIRAWMRNLDARFRTGGLRAINGAEVMAQPHDAKARKVEIAALYLKGQLVPADAVTEIALNDALDRLNTNHAELIQLLFAAAGRPMTGWSAAN